MSKHALTLTAAAAALLMGGAVAQPAQADIRDYLSGGYTSATTYQTNGVINQPPSIDIQHQPQKHSGLHVPSNISGIERIIPNYQDIKDDGLSLVAALKASISEFTPTGDVKFGNDDRVIGYLLCYMPVSDDDCLISATVLDNRHRHIWQSEEIKGYDFMNNFSLMFLYFKATEGEVFDSKNGDDRMIFFINGVPEFKKVVSGGMPI